MKQQQFIDVHQTFWQSFIQQLDQLEQTKVFQTTPKLTIQRTQLIHQYNQVCQHLALAHTRGYSPLLINHLQNQVVRAHNLIYQVKTRGAWIRFLRFFSVTFPSAVRTQWRAVALSAALFWGVGIIMGLVCYFYPEMIYTTMDFSSVKGMENMYDPNNPMIGRKQEDFDQSRFAMFGFYVFNNTSIGLRVFASGILFGIGTVLQLLFNAVHIGAIAGYLTQLGYTETFWSFVSGHAAFELGAITLSGAAGLLLAKGLWRASLMKRLDYLKQQAMIALPIITGSALMFIMAAMIEGFWSPQPDVPPLFKYIVGIGLIVLTLLYFIYTGRSEKHTAKDSHAT